MQDRHAIGSFDWMQATHGRLTWAERLQLLQRVMAPSMSGLWRTWAGRGADRAVDMATLVLPDSAAVRHALDEIDGAVSAAVLQHSMRTYLWAAALASVDALVFDAEFLLVTCLLHDLGMGLREPVPGCDCFAGQSAYAAMDSMQRFGWGHAQCHRLADAISLHMNGPMPLRLGADVEVHLLQQGAAFDVLGARWHDLNADTRARVLRRHPRLGFDREFAAFIAAERRRRPRSRAALMHLAGMTLMMKLSPFEK